MVAHDGSCHSAAELGDSTRPEGDNQERDHVSALTRQELISALVAMPQRELVEVIALALENRTPEVSRPEWEESRLALVEAHRFNEASGGPSDWELLLLARPSTLGEFVTDGGGPTQEGGCCGQTLASYSKRIVCPICGSPASAT